MSRELIIDVDVDGSLSFIKSEELMGLTECGKHTVKRVSNVLPTHIVKRILFLALRFTFGEEGLIADWTRSWYGPWEADMSLSGHNVILGPFKLRKDAIDAEIAFVKEHVL